MRYLYTLLLFLTCTFIASCYRMPKDGEVSTLPNVNNPNVTTKNRSGGMPDMGL